MTVAAIKVAPALEEPIQIVFGAVLVSLEEQIGHVYGYVKRARWGGNRGTMGRHVSRY